MDKEIFLADLVALKRRKFKMMWFRKEQYRIYLKPEYRAWVDEYLPRTAEALHDIEGVPFDEGDQVAMIVKSLKSVFRNEAPYKLRMVLTNLSLAHENARKVQETAKTIGEIYEATSAVKRLNDLICAIGGNFHEWLTVEKI